jgi:hypothetical protein
VSSSPGSGPKRFKARATVVERRGDSALLRLEDGRTLDAPVPAELKRRFERTEEVVVYLREEKLLGWAFEGEELGVNLGEEE